MMIEHQPCGAYTVCGVRDCRPSLVAAACQIDSVKLCAEIGAHRGDNARRIRSILSPKLLYLIDVWENILDPVLGESKYEHASEDLAIVLKHFGDDPKTVILKGDSRVYMPKLPRNQFDYVYIDGDHSAPVAAEDILNGIEMVRVGGILGGHDYGLKSGVLKFEAEKQAVDAAVSSIFREMWVEGDSGDWWVNMTPAIKERAQSLGRKAHGIQ